MTELERMAEQTIDSLERTGSPLTIEQDDEAKGIIRNMLETARLQGRIEGLEEAAVIVEKDDWPCDCEGGYKERGMISPNCIAHEWMPEAIFNIRARIKELEGE